MIYWDNNATTELKAEVLDAMLPFLKGRYMNPSSGYAQAKSVRTAIEQARQHVASLIGACPGEIIFTSGATESINAAIATMHRLSPDKPLLCLSTDHSAALSALSTISRDAGTEILGNGVNQQGTALLDEWGHHLSSAPAGATFTWGNNETGVIQPADEMVRMAHDRHIPVHVDAVQCLGKIPVNITGIGAEYASFSAHKLHGPKGIGALYVRAGVHFLPFISGGDQEDGRRGGTENTAGIVGFGEAARLALRNLRQNAENMQSRRNRLEQALLSDVPGIRILSSETSRLPNTSSIYFDGCTAQALSLLLEPQGLLCSAGSACKTASPHPSHVLTAMGLSDEEARNCLRFSISELTTNEELETGIRLVIEAVKRVRSVQSSKTGPVTVYQP